MQCFPPAGKWRGWGVNQLAWFRDTAFSLGFLLSSLALASQQALLLVLVIVVSVTDGLVLGRLGRPQ